MRNRRTLLIVTVVIAAVAIVLVVVIAPSLFRPALSLKEFKTIQLGTLGSSLTWSPDGSTLVVAARRLHLFLAPNFNEESGIFKENEIGGGEVTYSPDGTMLATKIRVGDHGGIQILSMPSGAPFMTIDDAIDCAFSPDSKRLVSASNRTVRVWDLTSRKEILTIAHPRQVIDVAFSPDGNTIATVNCPHGYPLCGPTTILLWDAATGRQNGILENKNPELGGYIFASDIEFSPDGSTLAAFGMFDVLEFWDWRAKELRYDPPESQKPIAQRDMAFTSDSMFIAVSGDTPLIRVWDVKSGREVASVEGKKNRWAESLAFNPDGTLLASINEDGLLRIWQVVR